MKQWLQWAVAVVILVQIGCNSSKKITKAPESITPKVENTFQDIAQATIFSDSNFAAAHVGISIYNPATQQYLYNYQCDKYFVPASNMKLFTCYAAMKNLGDSLVGLRYVNEKSEVKIQPTADPTFLHPDFKNQPIFDFIKNNQAKFFSVIKPSLSTETRLGKGWAWDDYNSDYMAERSEFPIYGNVVTIKASLDSDIVVPHIPSADFIFKGQLNSERGGRKYFYIRDQSHNILNRKSSNAVFNQQQIPFITSIDETIKFIRDTIKGLKINYDITGVLKQNNIIHSQPTDSLLKPMMHNSDNFFAEQTLLMVSNEKLGVMNDEQIIDTLLKTDFKGLPQKPRWVDGSGLSRYNLITPQDFVWVLTKMKADFGWQRITTILPTGNQGTLNNYYKNLAGNIFAKTGTLSGQVALSGYLITKQGKTLVFSVLVNNHQTSATAVRRGVEKFLTQVYEQY